MFEPSNLIRLNSDKMGRSPDQNRHIYTKILQNSSSSVLSARTSKTNSQTPYELTLLQDQKNRNIAPSENINEKEFKSIYSTNQAASSIDFKGNTFKNFQESFSNVNNNSNSNNINNNINNLNNNMNDNSRIMRKSLENLNAYMKNKNTDKYTELKQSIMNQIKIQNSKEGDDKNSSRDNSKQHAANPQNSMSSTHKSSLNYFSLNQNIKNFKTIAPNEKPPQSSNNKNMKKSPNFEKMTSPEKKTHPTQKAAPYNSIKKEKNPQSHLHSNKHKNDRYFDNIEKSHEKYNSKKTTNFNQKDISSHSFQQNPSKSKISENLNISDNSQTQANAFLTNSAKIIENQSENNTKSLFNGLSAPQSINQNPFDFTLLKSYQEKFMKSELNSENKELNNNSNNFIRENNRLEIKGTPPKKREVARSLPATTKNSSGFSFKGQLNEIALNNKAYDLLKHQKNDAENNSNNLHNHYANNFNNVSSFNYAGMIKNSFNSQNPNVKVNDLLNEELKNNSEKMVFKQEKEKCEECEQKAIELEAIFEKVRKLFDTHRKKETSWLMEKAFYLKQIENLNVLVKQLIHEKNN